MATLIAQRSTYWNGTGTGTPYTDGDMMWWWNIYYDQSESTSSNNRTKIIVDYYICTYKQTSAYADVISYGSGSMYCKINGENIGTINYSAGDIVVGDNYNLRYIGTKTKYIQHNDDGTGSFTWQGQGVGRGTSASTYYVPTIQRSSVLSNVSNFDVDNGVTVNTTKYVGNFFDKLEIYANDTYINSIKGFTSRTITFSETDLNNIYKAIPSNHYGNFTFVLKTYSDSGYTNQVGSESRKFATGYLKIVLPTFENYTYEDINTTTLALTGNKSHLIHKYSNVKITVPQQYLATANTRGATISHYLFNDKKVPYSNGATSVTSTHNKFDYECIMGYAVDTRGTSSICVAKVFTENVDYIYYEDISKDDTAIATRSNNGVGSNVTISFSGKWWNKSFGSVTNSVSATYKYKKSKASSYSSASSLSLTKSGNKYSFSSQITGDQSDGGFDISESYDIIVTVKDKLSSIQIKYTVPAGEPAIALYKNKASLGAMYDESLGGTQIWGDLYKDGIPFNPVDVSFASMTTNFTTKHITANDTRITGFTNAISYGDYEASTSNNQLVIRNTTLCQISGSVCGNGYGWLRLIIYNADDEEDNMTATMVLTQFGGNEYWAAAVPTVIIKLDPEKTYYLRMIAAPYNGSEFAMNSGFGASNTWMTALKIK